MNHDAGPVARLVVSAPGKTNRSLFFDEFAAKRPRQRHNRRTSGRQRCHKACFKVNYCVSRHLSDGRVERYRQAADGLQKALSATANDPVMSRR